jgi:hypothetical protein
MRSGMMNKTNKTNSKKLSLARESLRNLSSPRLARVNGGGRYPNETVGSCYTICFCTSIVVPTTAE